MSIMEENIAESESATSSEASNGGQISALHDLLAGGIAGSASVIVGHPFDTIKVRLQTGTSGSASGGKMHGLFKGMAAPLSTAAVVNAIIFATYGSSTRLWEDTFENGQHDDSATHGAMTGEGAMLIEKGEHGTHEQIKRYYSGTSSSQIQSELTAVRNTAVEESEDNKNKAQQSQNMLKIFTCGSIAGAIQAIVICPMEHIKCRLQVNTQQLYKGPLDVCTSIVKNHGLFQGLYRGFGVTLWRETPAFGMYFATYDTVKSRVETILEEKDEKHPIPSHAHAWAASALAGGISGAWTWAIIYPFDVIKTKIQTGPLEQHLKKGMWTVGRELVQEHGWKHMFRGLGVTLCRAFPVNAIIFPVYEFVLVQLGDGG